MNCRTARWSFANGRAVSDAEFFLGFEMRQAPPLLLVCLILLAGDRSPDAPTRFTGTWLLIRGEFDGLALPKTVLEHSSLTIDADRHILRIGEDVFDGRHRFDPTQQPKGCDITIETGSLKGQQRFGIYDLEGDQLTLCIASEGIPRPKLFSAPKGGDRMLTVWKRQSK